MTQPQSIQEFFSGRSVFITGATGFMGKVLVEKLLRSCSQVDNIYLLMRPKKGRTVESRIRDITDIPLFDRLRQEQPNALDKLCAVQGDVSELELGLSPEDQQLLKERVSILFHMAASVRFDDSLQKAVLINVRGTQEVVRLATGMKQLKVLLHVSTTYCNTMDKNVEERLYKAPADWRTVIHMVEHLDPFLLKVLTQKLLGRQPNTYTYTKSLAEHLINDHRDQLPVVIVRPSIVVSSIVDPIPGWIDNFNGPIALMVGAGKGLVHTAYCDETTRLDYIPVDIACKALIAACWTRTQQETSSMPVYQCAACDVKRITQGEMLQIGTDLGRQIPLNDTLYYQCGTTTTSLLLYYVQFALFQLLPAILVDGVLWLTGRQTRLLKIQRRIFSANMALKYFLLNDWKFENSQFLGLEDKLLPVDFEAFNYGLHDTDEVKFFKNALMGCRLYLLKEDMESLPMARRHNTRMAVLHYGLCCLLGILLLWFTYSYLVAL